MCASDSDMRAFPPVCEHSGTLPCPKHTQSKRRTMRRSHRAVHRRAVVFRLVQLSESGEDFQVDFSPAGPSRCRVLEFSCHLHPNRTREMRRRSLLRAVCRPVCTLCFLGRQKALFRVRRCVHRKRKIRACHVGVR